MYELASEATYANTVYGGETCMELAVNNDRYKENLETFILWLESEDPAVCFARDQALFLVPSNDGNKMMCYRFVKLLSSNDYNILIFQWLLSQ